MSRIYVASSWRNIYYDKIVEVLENLKQHEVYKFRSSDALPAGGPVPTAFSWAELDKDWETWTPHRYRRILTTSPRAALGYNGDRRGLDWCDTCVLVLPCGRSAHLEAGYCIGRGKRTIIHFPDSDVRLEPDLMYLMADLITIGWTELVELLR